MKMYYISSKSGESGICKYSNDFYRLVLKDNGYIFLDSGENIDFILSLITPADHVHLEIGIFQKKELQIFNTLAQKNYSNIAVTLHDPPLLKYPYYSFSNSFLNDISKFYDIYIRQFKDSKKLLSKAKTVYVLSEKGKEALELKYGLKNVYCIPHILDEKEIVISRTNSNNNFIYLGFIGKNKGIDYSLKLHQSLLDIYPETQFYIVGTALGKEKKYYDILKKKYTRNVHFMGFVPEENLSEIFNKTTFSLMPFKNYRFFSPVSGSLLYSLKNGKIPFTTNVNSIHELIQNGVNGYYLTGDLGADKENISKIFADKNAQNRVKKNIYEYLNLNHAPAAVSGKFNIP